MKLILYDFLSNFIPEMWVEFSYYIVKASNNWKKILNIFFLTVTIFISENLLF